jgi:hypothetical protein
MTSFAESRSLNTLYLLPSSSANISFLSSLAAFYEDFSAVIITTSFLMHCFRLSSMEELINVYKKGVVL